jgi:hypothetical protein
MASSAKAHKVRFDFPSGSVRTDGDERVVLVPVAALDDLAKAAGLEAACAFARTMGIAIGKRVSAHMGSIDAVRKSTLEAFITELGSELALAGWGAVSLERWGKAMVIAVEHAPVAEHRVLAAMLEGAMGAATGGRDVRCTPLAAEGSVRVLVAGTSAVDRVRGWLAQGVAWGEVLSRLQAPSTTSTGGAG